MTHCNKMRENIGVINPDEDGTIMLEIEKDIITCSRNDLVENSDYFRAMLQGNFIERKMDTIKLKGISALSMRNILRTLWDETYLTCEENIYPLLQAACMLQFVKVRDIALDRLNELLSVKNSLKIWLLTEDLDLYPLYLKAKNLALIEFHEIRELDCILSLNLHDICTYLGNTNLHCDSELYVFETVMKWFYEYCSENNVETKDVLKKLLACIDFTYASLEEIKEMKMYPDIAEHSEIITILECILKLKQGEEVINVDDNCLNSSKILLQSKHRTYAEVPCLLVDKCIGDDKAIQKQSNTNQVGFQIIYCDKFKRKRRQQIVDESLKDQSNFVYYDCTSKQLKRFITVNSQKCSNLSGFRLTGYKELIFLYGGEYLIGKGKWNKNVWAYDTIREKWNRISVMPYPRRHFESCVCGNYLYVIGGTGAFRVIQDNMFWYNYKEDQWSKEIMLPCPGRQIKCCTFKKKLFILNLCNNSGYFFNQSDSRWNKIEIVDTDGLIPEIYSSCILFSYRDKLFLRGKTLISLSLAEEKLIIVKMPLSSAIYLDDWTDSVVCGNSLYTLYNHKSEEEETMSLEKLNLDSLEISYVLDNSPHATVICSTGKEYVFNTAVKLFGFHHFELLKENHLVNSNCIL